MVNKLKDQQWIGEEWNSGLLTIGEFKKMLKTGKIKWENEDQLKKYYRDYIGLKKVEPVKCNKQEDNIYRNLDFFKLDQTDWKEKKLVNWDTIKINAEGTIWEHLDWPNKWKRVVEVNELQNMLKKTNITVISHKMWLQNIKREQIYKYKQKELTENWKKLLQSTDPKNAIISQTIGNFSSSKDLKKELELLDNDVKKQVINILIWISNKDGKKQ